MFNIELDESELKRLIDALTIACDAYSAGGMAVQSIPFELLRDRLETVLNPGLDDYGEYD